MEFHQANRTAEMISLFYFIFLEAGHGKFNLYVKILRLILCYNTGDQCYQNNQSLHERSRRGVRKVLKHEKCSTESWQLKIKTVMKLCSFYRRDARWTTVQSLSPGRSFRSDTYSHIRAADIRAECGPRCNVNLIRTLPSDKAEELEIKKSYPRRDKDTEKQSRILFILSRVIIMNSLKLAIRQLMLNMWG